MATLKKLLMTLVFASVFTPGFGMPQFAGPDDYNESVRAEVIHDSIAHPAWPGQYVHLFRPSNATSPCPVVLFCHGITATHPHVYDGLIRHIVSTGCVVVYSPYGTATAMMNPKVAYRAMWDGFAAGVSQCAPYIDINRLGVVGHSYGGGAAPWIANTAIRSMGWGRRAAYVFSMAPWYMHGLSPRQLTDFPQHVKILVQVFDRDRVNDHRIGKDMYHSIGVPASGKAFVLVRSDSCSEGTLVADHDVPMGSDREPGSVNALDLHAVYRLYDALAAYALNGDEQAAKIALGGNGSEQNYMGTWPSGRRVCEMRRFSRPRMVRTQPFCVNFWHHAMNPRTRMCRNLKEPLRIAIHTPVTIWNYALLLQQRSEL